MPIITNPYILKAPVTPGLVARLLFDVADSDAAAIDDASGKVWSSGYVRAASARYGIAGLLTGPGKFISAANSADWAFGTGDFTVQMWIKPASMPGAYWYCPIGNWADNYGWCFYIQPDGTLTWVKNSEAQSTGSGAIVLNAYTHIAISRKSGTSRIFINGALANTSADTSTLASTAGIRVGANGAGVDTFDGSVDEVDIRKGVALYTEAFEPPRYSPVTISAYWSQTDKSPNVTVSSDGKVAYKNTGNGHALVRAVQGRSSGKYYVEFFSPVARGTGTGSGDGITAGLVSGSYPLTAAPGGATNGFGIQYRRYQSPGDGIWTYVNGSSQGTSGVDPAASAGWCGIAIDIDNQRLWWVGDGVWAGGKSPKSHPTDQWMSFGGGVGTVFPAQSCYYGHDAYPTLEGALHVNVEEMMIGVEAFQPGGVLEGFLAWDGGEIPPVESPEPLPDEDFDYRKLLLKFDSGDGSTAFVDSSKSARTITNNGATQRATPRKWGASSGEFASNSFLSIADSDDFTLANKDFGIEGWFYFTNDPASYAGDYGIYLAGQGLAALGTRSFGFAILGTSLASCDVLVELISGTTRYQCRASGVNIPKNELVYIAGTRDGNTLRLGVNGVQIATLDVTGVSANDSSRPLLIGAFEDDTYRYYMRGFMDDVRFTVGKSIPVNEVPSAPFADVAAGEEFDDDYAFDPGTYNGVTPSLSNHNRTFGGVIPGTISAIVIHPYTESKRYWEIKLSADIGSHFIAAGIMNTAGTGAVSTDIGQESGEWGWRMNGTRYFAGSYLGGGLPSFGGGDVLMFAVDFTAKKMWVGKNGVWVGDPAAGTGETVAYSSSSGVRPTLQLGNGGSSTAYGTFRPTEASQQYDAPSGFVPYLYTPPVETFDPLWDNVEALLHFNGENNSTTFTDEVAGNTWTVNGGAKISTAQSLFGGASGDFTGNTGSKYIELADRPGLRPGTGPYSIEYDWYNQGSSGQWATVFQKGEWNSGGGLTVIANGTNLKVCANGVDSGDIPHGMSQDNHYRIEISRDGSGTCRVFINGALKGTFSQPQNINGTSPIQLMKGGGIVDPARGYLDEFRYTVGAVRNVAAYTPAASEFPNAARLVDLVALHLHMDGADLSTDSSTRTKFGAVSSTGVATATTDAAFGSQQSVFSGGKIEFPRNADFGLPGAFTISGMVRIPSFSPASQGLFNIGQYDSGMLLRLKPGLIELFLVGSEYSWSHSVDLSTRRHLEVSRDSSGNLYAFIDGVPLSNPSAHDSKIIPAGPATIGRSVHSSGEYLSGNLDEFRLIRGACLHTAAFTPPAVAYADDAGANTPTKSLWAIDITANNGSGYIALQEVELRTAAGGTDVTTPTTSVGSTNNYPGAGAEMLVDNDTTSLANAWVSSDTNPFPQRILFDLIGTTDLKELAMLPQAYSGGIARAPKDFSIKYYDKTAGWVTVRTFTGITDWAVDVWKTFSLEVAPSVAWNPSDKNAGVTLSLSNTKAAGSTGMGVRALPSRSAGIRQFEVTVDAMTDSMLIGLSRAGSSLNCGPGDTSDGVGLLPTGGIRVVGIDSGYSGTGYAAGDVVGVVYNLDTGYMTFYRNGVSLGNYNVGYMGLDLFPMVGGRLSGSGPWTATLRGDSLQYPVSGATAWGA